MPEQWEHSHGRKGWWLQLKNVRGEEQAPPGPRPLLSTPDTCPAPQGQGHSNGFLLCQGQGHSSGFLLCQPANPQNPPKPSKTSKTLQNPPKPSKTLQNPPKPPKPSKHSPQQPPQGASVPEQWEQSQGAKGGGLQCKRQGLRLGQIWG